MKKTRHEDDGGEISVALDNFDDLNRAIQEAQSKREGGNPHIIKRNTKTEAKASCCVCNRTYKEKEIGWTYRTFYKSYTCSTKCYEIAEGGWRDGKKIKVDGINVN